MLLSNLKIELKRIWKGGGNAFLGIIGLSVGLSCFIFAILYLNNQWGFDSQFEGASNIYRIQRKTNKGTVTTLMPHELAIIVKGRDPGVSEVTGFYEIPIVQPLLKIDDIKSKYLDNVLYADSSFFKVFNFPFVFGNANRALRDPNSIVISKEVSESVFHGNNPIGLSVKVGEEGPFVISGVVDKAAIPSHLSFDAVRLIRAADTGLYTYSYIKLTPGFDKNRVESSLNSIYNSGMLNGAEKDGISLEPISRIYLHSTVDHEVGKTGNATTLWLIACLVSFLLIAAVINFVNLNVADSSMRLKEFAIRKTLGSSTFSILGQLYLGIFLRCVFSLLIAFVAIVILLPVMNSITQTDLSLLSGTSAKNWIEIVTLFFLIILGVGTYPMVIIYNSSLISSLRGIFNAKNRGFDVRNYLLGGQIFIGCIFIAGVFIISHQIRYIENLRLGFNPKQVIVVNPGLIQTQFQFPFVKAKLMALPGVTNVSYSSAIGKKNEQTLSKMTFNGVSFDAQYIVVDTGYLNLMGAHFEEGKNFANTDTGNVVIINRAMAEMIGLKNLQSNGANLIFFNKQATVKAIVDDFNFYGFDKKVAPTVFTARRLTLTPFLLIKISSSAVDGTLSRIQGVWKTIEPGYPLRYQFMDNSFGQLFNSYQRLDKLISYLVICSVLLCFIGIFSLTSLVIRTRFKEMAIRKVVGASSMEILRLMNRRFVVIVFLANVFAWPAIYFLGEEWLNNFAYRSTMPVYPFVIASLTSLLLTVITVTAHSLKVAFMPSYKVLNSD